MRALTTPAQVGAIVSSRRKHLKLSQTDVATKLGLSQNRLSVLESAPEGMTVAQLLALANVLGLDVSIDVRAGGKHKVEW